MKINLLDCTLRDGGYINNWKFGESSIKHITNMLRDSHVDYIELGYIKDKEYSREYTLFNDVEKLSTLIGHKDDENKYIAMINCGDIDVHNIPKCSGKSLDGIRLCFSKKQIEMAYEDCKYIKELGYELFVQAMGADKYNDIEFVNLIDKFNDINPRAFYVVDSFGVLEKNELMRYLALADNNLHKNIALGYHSHNNFQQAYGNAKFMVEQYFDREIFIDSSIMGMGRGAGNLNTELFARYLNSTQNKNYNINIMLEIIDQFIGKIHTEHFWGYSLPFYLSAKNRCHPNYARYLAEKNTLSNKSLNEILSSMDSDAKQYYSEEKAEEYYKKYQENYIDDTATIEKLRGEWKERKLLILAPGKSLERDYEKIAKYIEANNPVIIAINVVDEKFRCDYVMSSNEKRAKNIKYSREYKRIFTSNLKEMETEYSVNYATYLCKEKYISDNPTLMIFNMLINMGIKSVAVAGFDGYGVIAEDNYFRTDLPMGTSVDIKLKKNELIKKELEKISSSIDIKFLTESLYK